MIPQTNTSHVFMFKTSDGIKIRVQIIQILIVIWKQKKCIIAMTFVILKFLLGMHYSKIKTKKAVLHFFFIFANTCV